MWNLKTNTNKSIYKTENRLIGIENKVMVTKGKREEEEGYIRSVGFTNTQSTIHKIDE